MLGSILDPFGGPAEASFRRNLLGPAKVPDLVDEDDVDLGREVFGMQQGSKVGQSFRQSLRARSAQATRVLRSLCSTTHFDHAVSCLSDSIQLLSPPVLRVVQLETITPFALSAEPMISGRHEPCRTRVLAAKTHSVYTRAYKVLRTIASVKSPQFPLSF